ncbi:hypothetical protein TL18_06960 [Methanobrevibacter sp. YE315]|uniref:hypothetical protein n=1 Tax=Methanobrevibacter sp. YE315 TaxID=1609968 RepID=UPI000764DB0F|nr:hypothetical protein [Methanobrevibacter sp. YE315]AMD17777.1 hypothetical protein TL18_06960 [Methanobrevibacter sp. YE315]
MIKKVQVLWYLNKEDLENYCIDFKEYKSHKLEGYEIVDVDEDLIYDLCDRDPDRLEPVGYFKNKKEIENFVSDYITNNEFELEIGSSELNDKIKDALENTDFSGEDYYISIGEGIGCEGNRIACWFDSLKKEYSSSSKDNVWVLAVTGYDPYDLPLTGRALSFVLADILNLNESSLDNLIPNKGHISVDEWNEILEKVYKKNKIYLGLNRVV